MNYDNSPAAAGATDPDLPMLTGAQATFLRTLAAPYSQAGRQQPLYNLAHLCRRAPQDRWPALVEAHFAHLREASQGGESAEELLRGAHARLLPVESLPPEFADSLSYTRTVADGLVFTYALDGATSVRILTDSDVERAGLEALSEAAYENLMRAPVEYEQIALEGQALLHSVYGDSHFVASKALHLSALARQVTGESLPDAGALVVMPTRHLLAFHPIVDGSVLDALNDLAAYALGAHEDGPGALSPRVYWWREGGLTSLTVIDHDTRVFSLRPPPQLLGLIKGLVRADGAGRLATRSAADAPGTAELTATTVAGIDRLVESPSALSDTFASALALSHAHCSADPTAARIDTWDAWAVAVQLGSALFTGAQPQQCTLGEDFLRQLPALSAEPPADARAWLDALYLAVVCRQRERINRLCQVSLKTLRHDDSVDDYVLFWIDTLQTYFSEPLDDVVPKLISTMETSTPDTVTQVPHDFLNLIDYQPVALFHRLISGDHDAFTEALDEALTEHGRYWGGSAAPRAQVALGPLAIASIAYDQGFPVASKQPCLPTYLLNRERIETIPG